MAEVPQFILRFAGAWLATPLVGLPVLMLIAILLGVGRALGVPRLFWNEAPGMQVSAGLAFTLVFLEAVLVNQLLEDAGSLLDVLRFAAASGALAALVILIGAWNAGRRGTRRRGRLVPGIRRLAGTERRPGPLEEPRVPSCPFLLGVLVGVSVAAALTWAALQLPDGFVRPALAIFGRTTRVPGLHLLALSGAVVFFLGFVFPSRRVPAAVGLCSLAGLVIGVHGLLAFLFRSPGTEGLVLLGLLVVGGLRRDKLGFAELRAYSAQRPPYPPATEVPGRLAVDTALAALEKTGRRRLVVVCTSGGGIRSATWTAAILGRLDALDGFRASSRWISGASGGAVGTAFWRAAAGALDWRALARCASGDSLSPAVRRWVYRDVPLAFLPLGNRHDRGDALQRAWCENAAEQGLRLDVPFATLADGEARGDWPSLVFSPMLVEDGRRLLLSNLDLTPATDHEVMWLSARGHLMAPLPGVASRTAYALADLCPGALASVTLATAARMAASFPWVSPAVPLPTSPPRRVVDAGYYDNYGLELACSWLRVLLAKHEAQLRSAVDGVLVIQIRDGVSELSLGPIGKHRFANLRARAEQPGPWLRGLQGLSSPAEGVLSARESVMLFRNDAQLESVSQLYARAFGSPTFLATTIFEFAGEASLSWHLSESERQLLVAQAEAPGIDDKIGAIGRWLAGSSASLEA